MKRTTRNLRLLQRWTLRSPLSHIGETISTTAYLVEEPIMQPDGSVAHVFSGNAWRGQLRDLMASYMLERIGSPTIDLDAFHLLYSGGAIGGQQQTDLGQARAYRRLLPIVSLLGGGVGNQVLPGKARMSNAYPLCIEALPALHVWSDAVERATASYAAMTFEKSFSRKDDSKDPNYATMIASAVPAITQGELLIAEQSKPARTSGDAPAQQMRMTVELVAAGVQLLGHSAGSLAWCATTRRGSMTTTSRRYGHWRGLGNIGGSGSTRHMGWGGCVCFPRRSYGSGAGRSRAGNLPAP